LNNNEEIRYEDKIKIWEKIIDVQKHFNEIKSKNQALFITLLTASLGAFGYLLKNGKYDLINLNFHIYIYLFTLPILAAVIFTFAFYIIDYHIYHILLKGAVEAGRKFEEEQLNLKLTSIIIEEVSDNQKFLCWEGSGNKLKAF
jgi:hypothetical protein